MTIEQILGDLKKKIYHPVYFLQGDEPYYIDQVSDYIERHVLNDGEKEFNQTVVYGKDLDIYTLISYAKRYPMMSSHQVLIVKEAQDMKTLFRKTKEDVQVLPAASETSSEKNTVNKKGSKEDRDPFAEYLLKPTTSTILVLCFKYNSIDKRTKIAKLIDRQSVFFDSKKMYDNQLPAWISKNVQSRGLKIESQAVQLMAESLGNDLTKIANEIDKLRINLKSGEEINTTMVAENIGVSKDFNIFELQKAIGHKNIYKAFQIAEYFAANPKNNPLIRTIPQLYSYFMKVLSYHSLADRSKNNAASVLGVNPFFLDDYIIAAREYSAGHCIRNISFIRDYDLRSKGVNNLSTDDGALLKELVFKIMN